MTESISFNTSNMKNTCWGCLRVTEKVFAMTLMERNMYRKFTEKFLNIDEDIHLCILCKWIIKKCVKFSQQCQSTSEIINQAMERDTKPLIIEQNIIHLTLSRLETYYLGPDYSPDLEGQEEEFIALNDPVDDDDDDEIPLVMLQDDYKNKRRKNYDFEPELEIDIKVEDIKEEHTELLCAKERKKKKEVKEGFSSRMVQETDEYVVIKLSKEQVLSELAERAKSESYIRSQYKCEKCVKGFNFEEVLHAHMKKHIMEPGSYKCDICSQYCPGRVSLRGHLKSHTTRYKCKLCGQVRLSRQHLLEHHAISHTAAPTTYTCDKCQFSTNKRTVIQRHVKTHASHERHACHRCGKLLNSIESLRVHTMRHDKSKRLQCCHCDKRFIYPSLLHKHIQAVHERKEYYCVECDVRFKSPESLRLHFRKAKRHRDPSSYKYPCPHCPQRFVTTSTLSVHLSCSHGAPKQHSCSLCHRNYSSREALRAHAWRVHTQRTSIEAE